MTLLDTHPRRFGWRIWYALPTVGRLITPVEAIALAGNTLEASCGHGHAAPSADCTCGVYYWPEMVIPNEFDCSATLPRPLAITFGVGLGPAAPDPTDNEALRTRRHRILAIFLPEQLRPLADTFAMNHRVPVYSAASAATCRAAATAAVAQHGPEWLEQLNAEPTRKPDITTRRYNEAMLAARRYRPTLDKALADVIEELLSPNTAPAR